MIYSRWKPDGGFEYYEVPGSPNIGDDLPDPAIPPPEAGIGTPAQECGRAMPAGARFTGRGDIPMGVITPAMRSSVSGIGTLPLLKPSEPQPLMSTQEVVSRSASNLVISGIVGFLVGKYLIGWR